MICSQEPTSHSSLSIHSIPVLAWGCYLDGCCVWSTDTGSLAFFCCSCFVSGCWKNNHFSINICTLQTARRWRLRAFSTRRCWKCGCTKFQLPSLSFFLQSTTSQILIGSPSCGWWLTLSLFFLFYFRGCEYRRYIRHRSSVGPHFHSYDLSDCEWKAWTIWVHNIILPYWLRKKWHAVNAPIVESYSCMSWICKLSFVPFPTELA